MRKLLLGSTAVVGFALLAPSFAEAQQAPTVRIGGYFRFNYSFTDQDLGNSSGVLAPLGATGAGVTLPAGLGGARVPVDQGRQSANTGKSDFQTDAEIHVIVTGKAANGLTYGATVEMQIDSNDGSGLGGGIPAGLNGGTVGPRGGASSKTTFDTDELYGFIASPAFGQLRFGDEDGPLGGLMSSGHITNFGTGGVDGDWFDSVIRTARAGPNFPGDIGDNTKIIYLTPQFFGFDFGASFAFNTGEGEDTGCTQNFATGDCDRANANSLGLRRRNEYQLAARWRGSFAGFGLSVTGGYMGADSTRQLAAATGEQTGPAGKPISLAHVGAQVTAFGLTVGGHYTFGSAQNGWGVLGRRFTTATGAVTNVDDRDLNSLVLGASYTISAFTVGTNYFNVLSAGSQSNPASRREWGYSVGATYRLAPGLELVAEYTSVRRRENGNDFDPGAGFSDNTRADVVIIGSRLAF